MTSPDTEFRLYCRERGVRSKKTELLPEHLPGMLMTGHRPVRAWVSGSCHIPAEDEEGCEWGVFNPHFTGTFVAVLAFSGPAESKWGR